MIQNQSYIRLLVQKALRYVMNGTIGRNFVNGQWLMATIKVYDFYVTTHQKVTLQKTASGVKDQKKRSTSKSAQVKKAKEHRAKMKDIAGITDNYGKSRIYHIYHGMIQRCFNKNDYHYADYGNRGIYVCDEWLGKDGFFYFYKWAMNNGYNDSLSIDRIDNNAGYSPNNCRWTIQKVQANNRRNSKRYPFNGKEMTVMEIGKINNVNPERLRYRLNKGMSVGDAILDLSQKGSHPLL